MNSPNYPPPGPYGPPQGQPYGQRPPQTPPGGQPYGGPPPQGPPYGAPPQGPPVGGPPPGGFGPPPGGPGGPPPAGPPANFPPPAPVGKKRSTGTIIKIVLGVIVVVVGAVIGIMNWGTSPANAKVGECIKVNSASASDADVEKIDCNNKDAVFKVGATFDSSTATCPKGDYVSYTQSGRRTSDVTLCLMLNAKEGDCFSETSQSYNRAECTAPDASFQIGAILNDTVDDSGCPEAAEYVMSYTEPKKMVMCLVAPGGGTGTT